jgi:hypothetical protein
MSLNEYGIKIFTTLGDEHNKMCLEQLDKALSGHYYDVAELLVSLYMTNSENTYDLLYDSSDSRIYKNDISRIYEWDSKTKLWKHYNKTNTDARSNFPNKKCLKYFIPLLDEMRKTIRDTVDKSFNLSFKDNGLFHINNITKLMLKCRCVSFKSRIWNEIKSIICEKFIKDSDNMLDELPLIDGTLYNISTGVRRMRTPNDFYTYSVNLPID